MLKMNTGALTGILMLAAMITFNATVPGMPSHLFQIGRLEDKTNQLQFIRVTGRRRPRKLRLFAQDTMQNFLMMFG